MPHLSHLLTVCDVDDDDDDDALFTVRPTVAPYDDGFTSGED